MNYPIASLIRDMIPIHVVHVGRFNERAYPPQVTPPVAGNFVVFEDVVELLTQPHELDASTQTERKLTRQLERGLRVWKRAQGILESPWLGPKQG